MSDPLSAGLGLFAALAPLGGVRVLLASASSNDEMSATAMEALKTSALGGITAFIALSTAALLANPFLEAIDVSGSAFLFAAGAAMAPVAARLILTGESMATPPTSEPRRFPPWLVPIGAPLLAGPASVVAAVAYAAHYGEAEAIAGAGIAIVAASGILATSPWLARSTGALGLGVLGRLSGALLIAIAVSLAVDGIHGV